MSNEQSEPKEQPGMSEIFGEHFVCKYTRADAIADGVLIEVPELDARMSGFTHPMAVNVSVWTAANASELAPRLRMLAQTYQAVATRTEADTDRVYFNLILPDGSELPVVFHCGPGDNGEPVLTLCEPSDL